LAQFPALSSIGVFITWRWWWSVISGRRRWRRTICDGASYKSACGDAAENASANGAADAVCICRRWSHHCSNGNHGSANRRDERSVHVFAPRGAARVPIRAVSLHPKGLLNRLVGDARGSCASSPLHKRIGIRPLRAKQLGRPGNAGSNPPPLIAREQVGCCAPPGLVLKIDIG
jgi:hypothetical protein